MESVDPPVNHGNIAQGSLFADDFLCGSITNLPDWEEVSDEALDALADSLRAIYTRFLAASQPNESQTEDDLIWPVLAALGWTATLRQQNLSPRGRNDVPDGVLFADADAKARAVAVPEEWRRYDFGLALVESKRWLRPLDRASADPGEETAPATQTLRYLRRVDDLTTGRLRWGILTNGASWRLYYQGARSVAEQFVELDLPLLLDLPGLNGLFSQFVLTAAERRHWLRIFALVFGKQAFLATPSDPRTFHQRAIDESRFHEQRVAANLSDLVFGRVFPQLVRAIAAAAPQAPLPDVREAALVFLYRLLFILYAEDLDLLPVRDPRYNAYALRDRVRGDIGHRKDENLSFSAKQARYWAAIRNLSEALDEGDPSIGIPPYNGGLFDRRRAPLLGEIELSDQVVAEILDLLSFERTSEGRRYINYRDLSVQQLGSIYERILEYEVVREDGQLVLRPNLYARKGSGSYYTPDDLVGVIVEETLKPLAQERLDAFEAEVAATAEPAAGAPPDRLRRLERLDPAERLLELRICDPAMGSGHFLVNLVDQLADHVIAAMGEAAAAVEGYVSPLARRIDRVRQTLLANVRQHGWTLDPAQLDDRRIVRRMALKRCVYGVDRNPMAVELAKVALWLHTFTVGAPLSFLDHHLRCGNSLFGSWVRTGLARAREHGGQLFLDGPVQRAAKAEEAMRAVEGLTDAEIEEVQRSAEIFAGVAERTAPLDAFLALVQAFDWLELRDRADQEALRVYFEGSLGDPVDIAAGKVEVASRGREAKRFRLLLARARQVAAEERFLNWQAAFPGVWTHWQEAGLTGGFDAVLGNPPWERMKLQQVEWFAARREAIALAVRASDRQRMIAALTASKDPLAAEYAAASERAAAATRRARACGDYPLLSGGDVNLYSLFVERAMTLAKPGGLVSLLTPSGIASDKTASKFFRSVTAEGRLRALYDFENRKPYFPDVDSRFKFCIFIATAPAGAPSGQAGISLQQTPAPLQPGTSALCASFLHTVAELRLPERRFPVKAEDFDRVNPNTGTAPIFRTRRDAALVTAIYQRLPPLVDRSAETPICAWPVNYKRMFDMTNDSGLFRTRAELEERESAYPVGSQQFRSPSGDWLPLYEGKMVQAFDHRAASVDVFPENRHRPAQPVTSTLEQHRDPHWLPAPQFWVAASDVPSRSASFLLAFKDVTSPTNVRSMIATLIPSAGTGNTLPVLVGSDSGGLSAADAAALLGNLNSVPLDFVARSKIQGQHLNWFIVEQLPVVPPERLETVRFGAKSAGAIVREAVLELTYTAHDLAPFALDLGYTDETGQVRPPFRWDPARRLALRAKLDAVFFHLYGLADRDDMRYVFSTFPIVEQQETQTHGRYYSRDLCLAYMNALATGRPDDEVRL